MALEAKGLGKMKWYQQVLLVAVICGALLAGFWYPYLSPIQADIDNKLGKVTALKQVIEKNEARKKDLDKIKKETLQLEARLEMLKSALPQEKETDQIFRAVQFEAQSSGLKVSRVSPKNTVDRDLYTEYPIDLDVTGTYHNVGAFLDKIRQLPRPVNISAVRLSSKASEGDLAFTSSVSATYTATTFVYKKEEPVASTAPTPTPVKK